jgi:hypothetical protein
MHTHTHTHTHTHSKLTFFIIAVSFLNNVQASSCGDAVFTYTVTPPNFAIQVVNLPPQFTDMKIDCNTNVPVVCATSLNVTDSTVVLDNAVPGQYTNLNDYNFLRSNKSIFPTFDNELVITPTYVGKTFFWHGSCHLWRWLNPCHWRHNCYQHRYSVS